MARKKLDVSEGSGELVDFSNVEDPSFEVMPKGNYPVVITECEFTYSQAGNQMWTMVLEVSEGEYEGRKLFFHVVFSEKALPFARRTLMQLAPDLLEAPFDPTQPELPDRFVNMMCIAQVGLQKYEGEQRNSVRQLLRAEGEGNVFG